MFVDRRLVAVEHLAEVALKLSLTIRFPLSNKRRNSTVRLPLVEIQVPFRAVGLVAEIAFKSSILVGFKDLVIGHVVQL